MKLQLVNPFIWWTDELLCMSPNIRGKCDNPIVYILSFYFDTSEIECSVISKLVHLQMPAKVRSDEDARSEEEEVEDDFSTAGGWAQGLAKGVFAHKRSSSGKRKLKSPKKQSRYEWCQIFPVCQQCIVLLIQ